MSEKRYILFAGNNYYPLGGTGDFKEDFLPNTIKHLRNRLNEIAGILQQINSLVDG